MNVGALAVSPALPSCQLAAIVSAFFTRLTPACHRVDPVPVKGQPRDEREPWWGGFSFHAGLS